jgi:guanylate kinase
MEVAEAEISHVREFDFVLVNHELDRAVAQAQAVLSAARLAMSRQTGLDDFTRALRPAF